jgi:hypothetical protein
MPNPADFPKAFAMSTETRVATAIFTKGIKKKSSNQPGRPAIFSKI